ncbi:MAG: methyltransferase [Pirellulaceae bacterium]
MTSFRLVFEKQWLHLLLLAGLLIGVSLIWRTDALHEGQLWGVTTTTWLLMAISVAVAHQVVVWFCWRTELHGSLLSRTMGKHGFTLYATLFAVLGLTRIALVFAIAVSNAGTLPLPETLGGVLAIGLAIPALYTFYSVERYFGYRRAVGADHFDKAYRHKPLVNRGIFRFTSNGMYVYGFLILWVPVFWWGSLAALCAAVFNHAYIWVHYLCTEAPDMRRIYGQPQTQ